MAAVTNHTKVAYIESFTTVTKFHDVVNDEIFGIFVTLLAAISLVPKGLAKFAPLRCAVY